jgi:hypothetical protein
MLNSHFVFPLMILIKFHSWKKCFDMVKLRYAWSIVKNCFLNDVQNENNACGVWLRYKITISKISQKKKKNYYLKILDQKYPIHFLKYQINYLMRHELNWSGYVRFLKDYLWFIDVEQRFWNPSFLLHISIREKCFYAMHVYKQRTNKNKKRNFFY